jgi:hypothetical protein
VTGNCRICVPLRLLHWYDEAEALARQCFYEALLIAGITDCVSSYIQTGRQCGIGHDTAVPNGFDKLLLADDAFPVENQAIEQVEYLLRDGNYVRPAVQLAPFNVKYELVEEIAQTAIP